ncbi:MAG TPA: Npt1/Npt2 family nucleotide transporter [Xanthomonadales bacterium]|nr:Npt1/Npt2 family nucleotide transporter [Xanthomonadales bacterium]
MNNRAEDLVRHRPTVADRLLNLFSDVHAGEGGRAFLMLFNIFLILVAYYIIKTVREPLILNAEIPEFLKALGIISTAEVKTFASAGQALVLMIFVPAYGWFASRVSRMKLIVGVTLFFAANVLIFAVAVHNDAPFIGVAFYIWVGVFSLSIIAQFWSYANDIYTKSAGDRLFPVIALGATAGSPVGAWVSERLFEAHVSSHLMLYLSAGLLLLTLGIYLLVNRNAGRTGNAEENGKVESPLGKTNAFALVFSNRYILLIALLLIVLNIVNTVGEFILSTLVVDHAAELAREQDNFDVNAYIGAFYASYFFWVNIIAVLLQAFVASRIVKRFGLAGVLFALPIIALGAYGFVALGATLFIVRWAKTAENSTDYSIMNTAKQLLWLPTTREEKYKAKQAVDSFFVRLGDLAAALVVFAGVSWFALGARGFAMLNLCFIVLWLGLAWALWRLNRRQYPETESTASP